MAKQNLTQAIQSAVSGVGTDPITNSEPWLTYTINGTPAPGIIAINGIKGFARETGWDKKRGKGQQGATLTLSTQPPAEGSITSWLWLPDHFLQWENFVTMLLTYKVGKTSETNSATITYPELALLNIFNVVVQKVYPRVHLGKQLWSVTVEFCEWLPPPPKSIVSTPIKADTVTAPELPGTPPPAVAAAQAAYYQASADHAAAAGAP